MFDLLKKKIAGFVDKLTKKEEQKLEARPEKLEPPKVEIKKPLIQEFRAEEDLNTVQIVQETERGGVAEPKKVEPPVIPSQKPEPKERRIKIGIGEKLKSIITGEVEIKESEVSEMLEKLEFEMLESDVALEVAGQIRDELRERLVGRKINRAQTSEFIKNTIKKTLVSIMSSEQGFDILDIVREREKPVKIMFLGINGAGKTTTIAKIAKMLMDSGHTVIFAAGDTFRAAAIEQLTVHADRLGVKIIKREYGSDPTAVAYDAVNYAKARSIDVILIDTAGRQDTNINLINELKKMDRVIMPDLKVYIGESIAGNAIIEQVDTFNKEISLDGVILTKLDCDAKGGTVISITKQTNVPVIYLGTGQRYEDIEKFDAEKIADRILA